MATRIQRLPYGMGSFSGRWYVLVAVLLVIIAVGAFAYSLQFAQGLVVTGMRDIGTMGGAPWGLYIAFDVYFMGVSFAGITVAALIRLLRLEHLKPVARMAQALAVISVILGSVTIVVDVGQPGRALLNLFRYGRPQSPFFGTFTLGIGGYLFGSLVYLYLDSRRDIASLAQRPGRLQGLYRLCAAGYRDAPSVRARHTRTSFWLALVLLPVLGAGTSTLGFVFGLQSGRPGWFSSLQAPGFIILAGVSGVGLLIVVAAAVRRVLGLEDELDLSIFRWLGNFLMVLALAYLYLMVADLLTSTYAAGHHEVRISTALLLGEYGWVYWGVVATLGATALLLLLSHLPASTRVKTVLEGSIIARSVLGGVLANVAAIGRRFLVVVPSQTHGSLLPYSVGSYSPTWVESSVILGLFALGVLLYILFIKVFPIVEIPELAKGGR